MQTPPAAVVEVEGVVIVGGGVAGSLLALALREQGVAVTLIDPPVAVEAQSVSATAISYGALPGWPLAATPLARLAAGASRHWRRLQQRHGELGWRRQRLRLNGMRAGLGATTGWLPFAQVDTAVLMARLPVLLAAAGVQRRSARVQSLAPAAAGWQLGLDDGATCRAEGVVLAAGAACRTLWPALPERLRSSWAAVLELPAFPPGLGPAAAWLPQRFARVELERRAQTLVQAEWVVDPGLVPWGTGALLGQLSLIRPGGALEPPPLAAGSEQQLRAGLAITPWGAALAGQPGRIREAAVAFCSGGVPLVGPVPQAPGLWVFSGFSAGFSQVPVLAPLLAQRLAAAPGPAARAERRLQRMGVWPAGG
ncbi:MAG: FAD-binding oxidoreductase [Cyanobacteria bacterium M_surface_10_m2_179]|nr:FAD-binding oxidoreductase [Cyanobacteria bacterium M_surface_10_m2_179]